MKRIIIIIAVLLPLLSISLTSFQNKKSYNINGIWIQENINWKDGSFYTIYVYSDTNFIRIASSQSKNKNGTINFMTEEGFIVDYGHVQKYTDKNKLSVKYRLLHRSITLTNEKLPSNIKKGEFIISNNDKLSFSFENEKYHKTKLYTTESIERVKALANRFVPHLLKEYNISGNF